MASLMRRPSQIRLAAVMLWAVSAAAAQPADDAAEFLRTESAVVSASRLARAINRAPATVYVVTGRQLRESGAQTLWEGLRGVPGLDVMTSRTLQGEVNIRGLNQPFNNRTLVLLDGKTVLNGFYETVIWETLPIPLEEIDRVEIVAGPVSALYGPNAYSGVINIITKRPEAVGRAAVSVSGGEHGTLFGSAMTGRVAGPHAYKLSLGWRSGDSFDKAEPTASRAGTAHGLYARDLGAAGEARLSGGVSRHRTRFSAATAGAPHYDGITAFLRGDWTREASRLRAFWNYGDATFEGVGPDTDLRYHTWDLEGQQGFELPFSNALVVGAAYRRNESASGIYGPDRSHHQDLWAVFFEDEWRPSEEWAVTASGRFDRHPVAGKRFSPRGAVLYAPTREHTVRFSGGSAFRNPTLVENYVNLTQMSGGQQFTRAGSGALKPESMTQYELAYIGRLRLVDLRAAVFHYRTRNFITFASPRLISAGPPPAFLVTATNLEGTRAWGAETAAEAALGRGLSAGVSYSYQALHDLSDMQNQADTAPKHKVSGTLTGRRAGWTASTSAHWVSRTAFRSNPATQSFIETASVPDYWLLNGRLAYAFADGFEAAVSAFNLLDRRHRHLLAFQRGAPVGRRIMGTLSWRLP